MTLSDVLNLPSLAKAVVVAASECTNHSVSWVHVIDSPDPAPWARPGQLVLTTGYAWPRTIEGKRELLREFARLEVTAIGFAVPQFFERVPKELRAEGDRLHLPLLEIPWEVPFAQITQEVHTLLLHEQSQLLMNSERIHRALTRAAAEATSLEDIAASLASLIGRSVHFLSPDNRSLACSCSQAGAKAPGCSICAAVHGRGEGLFGTLANTKSVAGAKTRGAAMRTAALPAFGVGEGVLCPIRVNGKHGGRVWVLGSGEPLTPLDVRAAEHAALVAAVHLAHQRELESVEVRIGRSFLDTLLEGKFEATPQTLERAHMLGFRPDGVYRVGLLLLGETVPLSRSAFNRRELITERLRKRLLDLGAPALVTASLNQLTFLLPDGHRMDDVWISLRTNRISNEISMVTSRPYAGVDGVRKGFEEVTASLPHAKQGCHLSYDDLLLPRVMQGDSHAQEAFVNALLAPLRGDRSEEKLIATLFALAAEGFQLNCTAEHLGIHISTLRHRLERIEHLSGLKLDNPQTRFRIQIAHYLSYNN